MVGAALTVIILWGMFVLGHLEASRVVQGWCKGGAMAPGSHQCRRRRCRCPHPRNLDAAHRSDERAMHNARRMRGACAAWSHVGRTISVNDRPKHT